MGEKFGYNPKKKNIFLSLKLLKINQYICFRTFFIYYLYDAPLFYKKHKFTEKCKKIEFYIIGFSFL